MARRLIYYGFPERSGYSLLLDGTICLTAKPGKKEGHGAWLGRIRLTVAMRGFIRDLQGNMHVIIRIGVSDPADKSVPGDSPQQALR